MTGRVFAHPSPSYSSALSAGDVLRKRSAAASDLARAPRAERALDAAPGGEHNCFERYVQDLGVELDAL